MCAYRVIDRATHCQGCTYSFYVNYVLNLDADMSKLGIVIASRDFRFVMYICMTIYVAIYFYCLRKI